jgi:hypothetical protein
VQEPVRGTFVYRDGKMVPKGVAVYEDFKKIEHAVSDLPAPAIRRDAMAGFKSPIDGSFHESKSGWEQHCKANGYTIVGNDQTKASEPYMGSTQHRKDVQNDVVKAVQMVEQNADLPPVEETKDFDFAEIKPDTTTVYSETTKDKVFE